MYLWLGDVTHSVTQVAQPINIPLVFSEFWFRLYWVSSRQLDHVIVVCTLQCHHLIPVVLGFAH